MIGIKNPEHIILVQSINVDLANSDIKLECECMYQMYADLRVGTLVGPVASIVYGKYL